mmetsp:Transcript_36701/g.77021  ORF Transcript_36701/g.77021 Transcript_36701/m.77021 type:complete len:207 (+) Transcript_36701:527-1147(+)
MSRFLFGVRAALPRAVMLCPACPRSRSTCCWKGNRRMSIAQRSLFVNYWRTAMRPTRRRPDSWEACNQRVQMSRERAGTPPNPSPRSLARPAPRPCRRTARAWGRPRWRRRLAFPTESWASSSAGAGRASPACSAGRGAGYRSRRSTRCLPGRPSASLRSPLAPLMPSRRAGASSRAWCRNAWSPTRRPTPPPPLEWGWGWVPLPQ